MQWRPAAAAAAVAGAGVPEELDAQALAQLSDFKEQLGSLHAVERAAKVFYVMAECPRSTAMDCAFQTRIGGTDPHPQGV